MLGMRRAADQQQAPLVSTKKEKKWGTIVPVKPKSRDENRIPVLEEGQVYVARSGIKYHTRHCEVVLQRGWAMLVTMLSDVGNRELCTLCEVQPEPLAFRKEVGRLSGLIADYLLEHGPQGVNDEHLRGLMLRYRDVKAELRRMP